MDGKGRQGSSNVLINDSLLHNLQDYLWWSSRLGQYRMEKLSANGGHSEDLLA